MKAVVWERYGEPEQVLELRELDRPSPGEGEVLVRVRASSVNPLEWHTISGVPYIARLSEGLRRPKNPRIGVDFAGIVEAVGPGVTDLALGVEVFGGKRGSLAEYVVVQADRTILPKPLNLSFEQAGSVAVAGITALQGLRDKGRLQAGQRVLINGASGGVGTFAVQIAKALGADVTAVCSTGNVELVRSLGADRVIDYTQEDFTRSSERYDLMLDIAGGRPWRECKRVLERNARLVVVGGPHTSRVWGPMGQLVRMKLASLGGSRTVVSLLAQVDRKTLAPLHELLASGKVTPVIDRTYELADTAAAIRYLSGRHARGKVAVTVS